VNGRLVTTMNPPGLSAAEQPVNTRSNPVVNRGSGEVASDCFEACWW
jgi:hypothetical protein